jgi:hypothetical protein
MKKRSYGTPKFSFLSRQIGKYVATKILGDNLKKREKLENLEFFCVHLACFALQKHLLSINGICLIEYRQNNQSRIPP